MLGTSATSDPLFQLLTQGGAVGILAFIVIGFMKGWIVTGRELKRIETERDRALELVYKQADIAGKAVDISMSRLELEEQFLELRRKEVANVPEKK